MLYITGVGIDHTCCAVVHGDCYVTIIVFLHTTPAYPNPCYVMIAVDRGSTSMIIHAGVVCRKTMIVT